jgi:hypothetical protein
MTKGKIGAGSEVTAVVLSGFGFRSRNRKGETHSKKFQRKKARPTQL